MSTTGSKRWMDRVRLLDDRPLDPTVEQPNADLMGLARLFAQSIRDAKGPMIIHVDGAWGRGKTSFCKYLDDVLSSSDSGVPRPATSSWYIASDETADPWDALLAAVARAVNAGDKEATRAVVDRWGSNADHSGDTLDEFRHFVARELGHEAKHERELELPRLVDSRGGAQDDEPPGAATQVYDAYDRQERQAVVFVDDLDRCRPDHVLAVFDSVRAFATCPGLAFVLAADRNVLEGASKKLVARLEAQGGALATDALEKYIRHRVVLPRLRDLDSTNRTEVMAPMERALLRGDQEVSPPTTPRPALFGGPLSLRIGVASLLARSFGESLTMRQLKLVLNTLVVDVAAQADRLGLFEDELGELWTDLTKHDHGLVTGLKFQLDRGAGREDYPAYYLTALLRATATHVWPQLLDGNGGTDLIRERFIALAAIGAELEVWPEAKLLAALDAVCPGSPQSLATRSEFARFARALFWSFGLIEARPREAEEGEIPTLPTATPSQPDVLEFVEAVVAPDVRAELVSLVDSRAAIDARTLRIAAAIQPADAAVVEMVANKKSAALDVGALDALVEFVEQLEENAVGWHRLVEPLQSTMVQLLQPERGATQSVLEAASRFVEVLRAAATRGREVSGGLQCVHAVLKRRPQHGPAEARLHEFGGAIRRLVREHGDVASSNKLDDLVNELTDDLVRQLNEDGDPRLAAIFVRYGVEEKFADSLLDVAKQLHRLEPGAMEFQSQLGLALATMQTEHLQRQALELLLRVHGSREWTSGVLYVVGSLEQRLSADMDVIGRCWEMAYRMGERRPEFLENFSSHLHSHRRPDLARLVDGKQPFPDEFVFRPVRVGDPEVEI